MNLNVYDEYQTASMTIFSHLDERYDTKGALKIVATKTRKIVGERAPYNWGELKFRIEIENRSLDKNHSARYKKITFTKGEFTELLDSLNQACLNPNRYIDKSSIKRRSYNTDLLLSFRVSEKLNENCVLWAIMHSHHDFSVCPIPALLFETFFKRQLEHLIYTMITFEATFDNNRILLENQEYMNTQIKQNKQIIELYNKPQIINPSQYLIKQELVSNDLENNFEDLPSIEPDAKQIEQICDIKPEENNNQLEDPPPENNSQLDENVPPTDKIQDVWIGDDTICPPEDVQQTKNLIDDFASNLEKNIDKIELDVNPKRLDVEELPPTTIQHGKIYTTFKQNGIGVEWFENIIKDNFRNINLASRCQDCLSNLLNEDLLQGMIPEDKKFIKYITNLSAFKNVYKALMGQYDNTHDCFYYNFATASPSKNLIDLVYELVAIMSYMNVMVTFDQQQNDNTSVHKRMQILNLMYSAYSATIYSVLAWLGNSNEKAILAEIKTRLKYLIDEGYFKIHDRYFEDYDMAKIKSEDCHKYIEEFWNISRGLKVDTFELAQKLYDEKYCVLQYDTQCSEEQIYDCIKFETFCDRINAPYNFDDYKQIIQKTKIGFDSDFEIYLRRHYTTMGNVDLSALNNNKSTAKNNKQPEPNKKRFRQQISGPYRYLKKLIDDGIRVVSDKYKDQFMDYLKNFDCEKDFDFNNFPFRIQEFPSITLAALYLWKPQSQKLNYLEYIKLVESSPHKWKDWVNIINENKKNNNIDNNENWFEYV